MQKEEKKKERKKERMACIGLHTQRGTDACVLHTGSEIISQTLPDGQFLV